MKLKEIQKAAHLYFEMSQAETDKKAKKRLMKTSEMLYEFENFVAEANELLSCEILPYDSKLASLIRKMT